MNYGHKLEFGTFITPKSATPDHVVALAKRSEDLGYTLASFQDHPYQPALLDTWTLLSWVAGKTERIQIAPNVLNLPLRPPIMIAHAAASLDLLSNGRVSLGLGAGAFWDGIGAMGAQKLTPGEAVEALDEALDLIRQTWDVAAGRTIQFHGTYYHASGAHPGPLPAHDIPIWLGAYKPRMLRLIGRKADGWLPSLSYLKPGEITAANAIIDEAAKAAGRDPREIRRILNVSGRFAPDRQGFLQGPSEQWVEELLSLVVNEGVGTFILASDDAETIEQFAVEVIPALRDAATQALPGAFDAPQPRRASVRAKRMPGIDYDNVPASLRQSVIEPGDLGYANVKSTYMRGGTPGLVLQPKNPSEVIEALAFARKHSDLPLSIRSGGHGISGRSTNHGGLVIDVGHLNSIEVLDTATRRVRIGPGARWMEVAQALEPYGWALSSGDYGGVGVGGLATAGGVGWLARQHGLTIDHLRAVEVVLADGRLVRASADENPDLFWAMRGAGANFGIATAFEFEADQVGNVGWAQLLFDASEPDHFLYEWGKIVESSPRDLTSFLIMAPARRNQPMLAQVMAMVNSDDPETILARLQPMANIAQLYDQRIVITSYANVMANAAGDEHNGVGEPTARSALIKHITPGFARDAGRLVSNGISYFFQIRSVGGAVSDVPADATAYAGRDANFSVVAFGANRDRLNANWDLMKHHFTGLYLSFETDQRPERLHEAFPSNTLERLRQLKQRYDPDNVFRDNFNVTPQQDGK